MKSKTITVMLLLATLPAAIQTSAGPGVVSSDGSYGAGVPLQIEQETKAGGEVRYLVPHMRSAQFSTGIGGRVTTVISATNGGTTPCDVNIDFHFAFNSNPTPVCTISFSLVPLLANGTDTVNACSRSISGDRWTLCTATCSPSLTFIQGKAIIRAPESCAGGMTFDARLYHSDTADDIRAINALQVIRLRD